jgi:hypothetical protein
VPVTGRSAGHPPGSASPAAYTRDGGAEGGIEFDWFRSGTPVRARRAESQAPADRLAPLRHGLDPTVFTPSAASDAAIHVENVATRLECDEGPAQRPPANAPARLITAISGLQALARLSYTLKRNSCSHAGHQHRYRGNGF